MDAITAEEVTKLKDIKNHRDEIAHEMPRLLVEPDVVVKTQLLAPIVHEKSVEGLRPIFENSFVTVGAI